MSDNLDKYYTQLDKELQQLALVDWPTFVQLIGEDEIIAAKICLLKKRGNSVRQIAGKLAITARRSQVNCEKCEATIPLLKK